MLKWWVEENVSHNWDYSLANLYSVKIIFGTAYFSLVSNYIKGVKKK